MAARTSTASAASCMRCSPARSRTPGRTPQAVIAKRVLEPLPHVRTVRASVPVTVEQAINRALAVTPADRFATAAEFARALAQPLTDPGTTNTPAAPQPMAVGRQRRVPRGLATLALGVLLGVGMLLAWLRTRPQAGTAGPKRLAVLPFENLGRPEDEYFTDGLTDAVRGKLTELPGLQGHRPDQLESVQAHLQEPAADRP